MVAKISSSDSKTSSATQRSQSDSAILENKDTNTEINFVRTKLETFQTNVINDVQKRMSGMIDEVLQDMRQHDLQANEFKKFATKTPSGNIWSNRIGASGSQLSAASNVLRQADTVDADSSTPSTSNSTIHAAIKKRTPLPDKVFVTRESYLTALLEVDHMKTIYHIFFIILSVFFMNSICYDYFVEGRINFGLGTFQTGFGNFHYVLCALLVENLMVFTLFYAVKGWAIGRSKLVNQRPLRTFWSNSCLITYVSSQLLLGYVASALCLKLNLPFASASVLLAETTRLLMKMHAFVRTVAARVIAGKSKVDDNVHVPTRLPTFGQYLYYIFAPTLIYRDNYPRTSRIRWRFATARFLEVVAIAFLYSYIHERHIQVHFYNYGMEELTKSSLIVKFFGMLMPSIIIFLCGFYLLLHSWLNFTGELLRFGDRMFYKDWWTSRNFDAYYRNWNVVVHDWLYEYIYKDFYTHIFKGSKLGASLMVFFVSAVVHEHILAFALQLFFPVMFVSFGVFGVLLVFITRRFPKNFGNVFLWFSLIFGNGTVISLYSMEYYARFNCPKEYNSWVDYLVPAAWNCYKS